MTADPSPDLSREHCASLDRQDPLAFLRRQFTLPEELVYLDGNSLGARPRSAAARAAQLIEEEWGHGLIRSWNAAGWFTLPQRLGDKLAPLVGAGPGEVVVTDTTSVNLFKVLAAALRVQQDRDPKRRVIVSERSNFPTDLYIVQGLAELLQRGHELRLVDSPGELLAAVGEDTAVLMLTHVNYRTGEMHDMRALTAMAHARGALSIWDLAHSAGAVPVDLHAARADYAVGCTYKYLNGGPGAPAFLWVSPALREASWQPLSGWWGHASPFAMECGYRPAEGIERFLCGTQAIVSLALVECGLDVFALTDIAALRAKSLQLTDLFIRLVEARCGHHPVRLVTPREHESRGSQVCISHPAGYAVMQALIERGVIGDFREPDILRFGFAPLYNRYTDAWDAVEALREVLDGGTWQDARFHVRSTVT